MFLANPTVINQESLPIEFKFDQRCKRVSDQKSEYDQEMPQSHNAYLPNGTVRKSRRTITITRHQASWL